MPLKTPSTACVFSVSGLGLQGTGLDTDSRQPSVADPSPAEGKAFWSPFLSRPLEIRICPRLAWEAEKKQHPASLWHISRAGVRGNAGPLGSWTVSASPQQGLLCSWHPTDLWGHSVQVLP